ncbi:MAG: glycosyltransferase [Patescibacteria group bacterium]
MFFRPAKSAAKKKVKIIAVIEAPEEIRSVIINMMGPETTTLEPVIRTEAKKAGRIKRYFKNLLYYYFARVITFYFVGKKFTKKNIRLGLSLPAAGLKKTGRGFRRIFEFFSLCFRLTITILVKTVILVHKILQAIKQSAKKTSDILELTLENVRKKTRSFIANAAFLLKSVLTIYVLFFTYLAKGLIFTDKKVKILSRHVINLSRFYGWSGKIIVELIRQLLGNWFRKTREKTLVNRVKLASRFQYFRRQISYRTNLILCRLVHLYAGFYRIKKQTWQHLKKREKPAVTVAISLPEKKEKTVIPERLPNKNPSLVRQKLLKKLLHLSLQPLMFIANFGKKKIKIFLRQRQEKSTVSEEEKELIRPQKAEGKSPVRDEQNSLPIKLIRSAAKYGVTNILLPHKKDGIWQVKELTPPANVQEDRLIAPSEADLGKSSFQQKALHLLKNTLFTLRPSKRALVIFFFVLTLGVFSFGPLRQIEDSLVKRPLITEQVGQAPQTGKEGSILGEKKTSETKTAASVKTKLALSQLIGQFLAAIALLFGMFFFVYSLKYYSTIILVLLASQSANQGGKMGRVSGFFYHLFFKGNGINGQNGNGNGAVGLLPNFQEDKPLPSYPFVCIQLPFYNEKKVVNRILTACTSFDYPNYEVVVADDSTDETIEILAQWQNHPRVKILHREDRSGFKGGALREAMKIQDPRTEFVIIFDADFIPYPDTIKQFLKYFLINGDEVHSYKDTNLAAVQGYQWHVLNKNENWITRSVRTEFSGSYVIERPGTELVGSLKQIAGSVYMIRADVLAAYNWTDSITEDFELTMRIYRDGWKVIFTPYIQAPAECVSTIKRLIRQRMRWAEGHTNNIRRYFWSMLKSPYMSRREKAEFLYLAPYYLQSAFLLVGTACWFVSDVLLHAHLPFWTAFWGWSLVFTNLFALPLMNTIGLFFEESSERDYLGTFSFLALCYILAPFQALAAIRGLFAKEGGWFRTPKSGHITDLYFRSRYRRWFRSLFPGRKKRGAKEGRPETHYLKLATSHSKFQDFKVKKRKGARTIVNLLCLLLVGATLVLNILGSRLPSYSQSYTLKPVEQAIEKYEETTGTAEQTTGEEITEKTPAEENAIDQSAPSQTDNDNVTAAPQNSAANTTNQPQPKPISSAPSSAPKEIAAKSPAVKDTSAPTAPKTGEEINKKNPPADTGASENPGQPIKKAFKMARSVVQTGSISQPEFIFEKQPAVSIRQDEDQIKLTTLSAEGLGALNEKAVGYRKESQTTYPEVFPGVDLRYTLVRDGLLEEYILNQPQTLTKISETLQLSGVTLLNPDPQTFVFTDTNTKKEKFRFDVPKMYELNNQSEENEGLHFEVSQTGANQYLVDIVLDKEGLAWLNDPARTYPVVIDPSVIVSGGITAAETQFGSNQRKLIYSASSSAWYAFHANGGVLYYQKCLASSACDEAGDWGGDVQVNTLSNAYSPSAWINSTATGKIYVAYITDQGGTADRITFRTINTASSDTQGTECYSADVGSIGSTYMTTMAVVNSKVYVAYSDTSTDTEDDIFYVSSETTCTAGTNWTSINTGSGLTDGDRPVLMDGYYTKTGPVTSPALHVVYQDGNLSHSVYVDDGSPAWDVSNTTMVSNASTEYSLTGDGTSGGMMYVVVQSSTTGVNFGSFNSGSVNNTTWTWVAEGPFADQTNLLGATISYDFTNAVIMVATTHDASEQGYFVTSSDGGSSWSGEYSFGFSAGDLSNISSPARTPAAGLAVVIRQTANFEYAKVPENVWLLFPFIAFLPKQIRKLIEYIKGRKNKKKWSLRLTSIFGLKKRK